MDLRISVRLRKLVLAPILAPLLALLLLPVPLPAQAVQEYDLKAAFVYNFVLFTEWPSDTHFAAGTLDICVNPSNPMRSALATLQSRMVKGRNIAVRALAEVEAAPGCHVLVLDASDRKRWRALHAATASVPILTIADDPQIGSDGSIIAFELAGGRAVFHVDTRAARDARLVLSSKLLRLARTVQ